jgi:hypothetical protein
LATLKTTTSFARPGRDAHRITAAALVPTPTPNRPLTLAARR